MRVELREFQQALVAGAFEHAPRHAVRAARHGTVDMTTNKMQGAVPCQPLKKGLTIGQLDPVHACNAGVKRGMVHTNHRMSSRACT